MIFPPSRRTATFCSPTSLRAKTWLTCAPPGRLPCGFLRLRSGARPACLPRYPQSTGRSTSLRASENPQASPNPLVGRDLMPRWNGHRVCHGEQHSVGSMPVPRTGWCLPKSLMPNVLQNNHQDCFVVTDLVTQDDWCESSRYHHV